ncbi:hypothetical protein DSO57_1037268 [Entomophthora muscae]|uniref:Uncharacterized protein n=1 Tax=Entomophthora muscae TaxID=34485 RepID=A0ACC2SC58_9FUNG|nr:hypothetical protein DSO57_1037268 [Entomophthora muscae]
MNLLFDYFMPYIILVLFHLCTDTISPTAPAITSADSTDPLLALFHPSGTPFGPIHFTKHPLSLAFSRFILENIFLDNLLCHAMSCKHETFGREEYWYTGHKQPSYHVFGTHDPFCDTQPNHPQDLGITNETTSTQLFGVIYITLTGLMDSTVLCSVLWSLIGWYLSYIIKLVQILWWALPNGLAAHLSFYATSTPLYLVLWHIWSLELAN